jgi:hypothetical protein
MQHAQILVYGIEGKLADTLRTLAQDHAVWFREVRHPKTCLNLLRRGGAAALVLKVGRDLEQELSLLARVTWLFPETASLLVGDSDNPSLVGLLWELGAHYVLCPPQPIEWLPDLVRGFLPARTSA